MPNYCSNRLDFTGPSSDIIKLKNFVATESSLFDFNKIIPMPPEIRDTQRGSLSYASEAVVLYLQNKEVSSHLKWMMEREQADFANFPILVEKWEKEKRVDLELGKRILNNRQLYQGCGDWYEWSIENWGTKWDACDPEIGETTIIYDTAWSPSLPVIETLAAKFPQLTFTYQYFEPGVALAGCTIFENGKCSKSNVYCLQDEKYFDIGRIFGYEFT